MVNMRCRYCDHELEKGWNFCPGCGRRFRRDLNLSEIVNKQIEQIKRMFGLAKYDRIFEEPSKGVTISISSGFGRQGRQPSISVKPITVREEHPYREKPKLRRKMPKTIIEPKTEVKRLADKIIVNIDLPGINSEEDVELARMFDSSEIRAYANDKGYFKIVKVPKRYKLIKKKLKDNNLRLEFVL